jgi:ribosomal protein L14E/L6E/L27E
MRRDVMNGKIVRAISGRDAGNFFVILCSTFEKGCWYYEIADGRTRFLAKPKKKNGKHLAVTKNSAELAGITDKKLRAVLHDYNFPPSKRDN